jgi:hypothetical protein
MKKAMSVADIPLVMQDPLVQNTDNHSEWLKVNRHDMAMNVRGVLADVKKGGLRRDLSLAFEMDGTADVSKTDQPSLFNQQDGEFVGGNDSLQALYSYSGMTSAETYAIAQTDARDGSTDGNGGLAPGMTKKERYLYRVTKNDGSPFSGDLKRFNYRHGNADVQAHAPLYGWYPNSVVRGPNWWALRDYYNLYKRVSKSGVSYALESRSYYPNNSATGAGSPRSNYRQFSQPAWPFSHYHYDMEVSQYGDIVFQPATPNYTPIYMGMTALYSMKVKDYNVGINAGSGKGTLTLAIDPLIYLWNPFNVTLKAERFAVELQRGHGGKMSFLIEKTDGSKQKYGPAKSDIYIQKKAGGGGSLTYLVRNLEMEPGEVMIVSPGAGTSNTDLHDEATPGTNLTDQSGIEVAWMPTTNWSTANKRWELQNWTNNVQVGPTDKIYCLYDINLWHSNTSRLTNSAEHYWMATFMPNDKSIVPSALVAADTDAERVQQVGGNFAARIDSGYKEYFVPDGQGRLDDATGDIIGYPYTSWPAITLTNPPAEDSKFFFGINSHFLKPTKYTKVDGSAMPNQHAVEVFSQFNPFRTSTYVAGHRTNVLNEAYSSISTPGSVNNYIQQVGVQFPTAAGEADRGFWGETMHGNGGSTAVPFIDIPSAPILSLVDFANANLSLRAEAAYKDVGNSHASIFVPGDSLYGNTGMSPGTVTTSDTSWLMNDVLFDRYYLSGIAPEFTFGSGVYNTTAASHTIGLANTLKRFYGIDPSDPTQTVDPDTAQANPVLEPYIPANKTAAEIVTEVTPIDAATSDAFKKLGAYSLIKGAFNVNSTSAKAWEALLRANRNLALANAAGTDQTGTGTPFSGIKIPINDSGADTGWDGFSRLSDAQITGLAVEIVNQVKARGPFMSISDFVNRQVSNKAELNASGALQAALDIVGSTSSIKTTAGGLQPKDSTTTGYQGLPFLIGDADLSDRLTTEGIAGDIRQADVLRALAPRLSARTDTFRIRSYGEVRDADDKIIASATCEAVVQRLPEYVDPETDAGNNKPWDDDSKTPVLNAANQTYGRRFEIRSFRWLDDKEV